MVAYIFFKFQRVDTMPESSQLNKSARALRNSSHKKPEPAPDFEIFKPNGEPVWVVDELAPGECVNNEDGVVVKNPELAKAMAADNLVLEEIDLIDMVEKYLKCTMPRGTLIPEKYFFKYFHENRKYVSFSVTISTHLLQSIFWNQILNMSAQRLLLTILSRTWWT